MDRQLLLIKKEVTYGTDPTLAALNAVLAEGVQHRMTGQRVRPNPAKPGVGPVPSWTYGEVAEVAWETPLAGAAAAGTAPNWGYLMKAAGWKETIVASTSVTYDLVADPLTADSLAIQWREGRRKHLILGARGRVGLKLSAGQRPMLVFSFRGLHQDVTTAAALAHADADFTNWKDTRPVAQGTTTYTFNSVTGLGIREYTIDQSDNVKFTDVPEQENVELRGERRFTGKAAITCPLPSALNLETLWKAGTLVTSAMVHNVGGAAGSIVTVNARHQVADPSYSRVDDQDVASFTKELAPSSLTTDNDLSIVIT